MVSRSRSTAILASLLVVLALAGGACSADTPAASDSADEPGDDTTTTSVVPTAVLTDQPYTSPETSVAQVLDLWVPEGADGPVPVAAFIHGGGWVEGSRQQVTSKLSPLLDAGFAVASIDYRLSSDARFPAAVQDAKAAVRWVRANAARLGLDPDSIAAWGESAGANLATLLGVTGDQPTLFDDSALGNTDTSSAVQAVVDWFGPVDLLQLQTQATNDGVCPDPYNHDAGDSHESKWRGESLQTDVDVAVESDPITYIPTATVLPPFSIAHGDENCVVDVEQSLLLAGALQEAGQQPIVTILPRAAHMDARFDAEVLRPTISWLPQVLSV